MDALEKHLQLELTSLQNRRISGVSAIHERAREARGQKNPPDYSGWALPLVLVLRARSCIALSLLICLFCRLPPTKNSRKKVKHPIV